MVSGQDASSQKQCSFMPCTLPCWLCALTQYTVEYDRISLTRITVKPSFWVEPYNGSTVS